MRSFLTFLLLMFAIGALQVFGQGGGKAEPLRIKIPSGRTSTMVSGKLSNGQEMDYIFSAVKGQTVVIRNSKTKLFDFRVFSEEFDFETEFESSPTLTFPVPESGDYNLFVRKKMVKSPGTARFSIWVSIR